MKLFEGKSPTERNKTIAAIALGVMCLVVFYFAFGRGLFGGSATTTVTVKASPTPRQSTAVKTEPGKFVMPSNDDQYLNDTSIPIFYDPSSFNVPDPGRNIFAFYEPGLPTPIVPLPIVIKTPPPASPTPTPPIQIAVINPQSIYAGSKGFRLEIAGDNFTPDSRIYFGQREMPTTFVNAQRLVADIPAVLITGDGARQVIVQTPDGKLYSNQVMLDVQAPPKPQFQYIGMIARTRSNNDTAYFLETGKQIPTGARLNDVVEGRYRLLSISAQQTVLEDVGLGFKHRLPLFTPPPGTVPAPSSGVRSGFPSTESYVPFNPPAPAPGISNSRIPGIPDNIPRYIPPNSNSNRANSNTKQRDLDDDEDNDN